MTVRSFFYLILCSFASISFSQTLSFDELIKLHTMDISDASAYLLSRDWHLHKTTEPSNKSFGDVTWISSTAQDLSDLSFFKYYYAPGKYPRVAYIFKDNKLYKQFAQQIKNRRMKKISTVTPNDMVITDYLATNFVISVSMFFDDQEKATYYTFLLFDKRDFERLQADENKSTK
jgi:hypothetical protein